MFHRKQVGSYGVNVYGVHVLAPGRNGPALTFNRLKKTSAAAQVRYMDTNPILDVDASLWGECGDVFARVLPLANENLSQYYHELGEKINGKLSYKSTGCDMKFGAFAEDVIPEGQEVALFAGSLIPHRKIRSEEDAYVIHISDIVIPRSENDGKVLKVKACIDGVDMVEKPGLNGSAFNHSCFEANCVMTNGVTVQTWSYESHRYCMH